MHSNPNMAQTVAVATPCCPAPVSAMILSFPSALAIRACPMALLILWAPVCARSSLFSQMLAPPANSVSLGAKCSGVGPPTNSFLYLATSARNSGSTLSFLYSTSISRKASESVSGMNCPPNSPKRLSSFSGASAAGSLPMIFAWLAGFFCFAPVTISEMKSLQALALSAGEAFSPALSTALRMAEPTTTPSPISATWFTC
mmetsp:Transcript_27089/g.51310  ORF Transcript_27089/g.51310 Transcript_27089/m.51310 type:complete len:201 (-) Transcript_27089:857-1459(-)